jgi:CobQ-like glutamine amidotransferase family enzyme
VSSYVAKTRVKATGEIVLAEWLDDHFGKHLYGVRLPDGRVLLESECEEVPSVVVGVGNAKGVMR